MTDAEITQALDGFEQIETDGVNWTTLYRHHQTGRMLEVFYPQSEMHGGGPRALRAISHQEAVKAYPRSATLLS